MATTDVFDVAVLGSGPGGYVAAIRAGQLGLKTAIIERDPFFGGTCLHRGCIPTKAFLHTADLLDEFRHADTHGVTGVGDPRVDMAKLLARKDKVVGQLAQGVKGLLRKNKVTLVNGRGTLAGRDMIAVAAEGKETATVRAKHILLATGSEAVAIPGLPFDGVRIGHARHALAYDRVPQQLVVVGGGYIGLELGSVWLRLGARVTVVEMLDTLLPSTDQEVAALLLRSLEKQGMTILPGTRVASAAEQPAGLELILDGKHPQTLSCDRVLVAAGRRPLIGGLGLEAAGIKLDGQGRVEVDADYQTSCAGVYAVGDLIHGPMLAHKAMDEGAVCVERLHGERPDVDYRLIPGVVYTQPEVAAVGQTEEQLKAAAIAYAVGKFPFLASGRARALDETEGFVKVLVAPASGRLLGVHIIGPRASELIAEAAAIMAFGGSVADVALITHAHPTLSEAFREATLGAASRAVHL